MYYLTKSKYMSIIKENKKKNNPPLTFPDTSFQKELDKYSARFLGWAIWCFVMLPEPQTNEEKKSIEMVKNYLKKNLTIVDDSDADKYELYDWDSKRTVIEHL